VVDGGGNRPQTDAALASLSDLVLIPFRDSNEDMRTAAADLARFPRSCALPSQWPTNPMQRRAADRSVSQLLGAFRGRMLAPVYAQSATKLLLQHELPARLPSALHDSARMLALQVMEQLHIALPDDRWRPIARQQASARSDADDAQRAA
jgi:hypothetical protein